MNRDEIAKSIIERGRQLGKSEETIKKALEAALADFDAQQPTQPTAARDFTPEEKAQMTGLPVSSFTEFTPEPKKGVGKTLLGLGEAMVKPVAKLGRATGDLLASGARTQELERGIELQKSQDDIIIQKMNEAKASGNTQEVQRLQGLLSQGIDYGEQAEEQEKELKQSRSDFATGVVGTSALVLGAHYAPLLAKQGFLTKVGASGLQGAINSIGSTDFDVFKPETWKSVIGNAATDAAVAAALAGIFYGLGELNQKRIAGKLGKDRMSIIEKNKSAGEKINKELAKAFDDNIDDIRKQAEIINFTDKDAARYAYMYKNKPEWVTQHEVEVGKMAEGIGLVKENYAKSRDATKLVLKEVNGAISTALEKKKGLINLTNEINQLADIREGLARSGVSEKQIANILGVAKDVDGVFTPSKAHELAVKLGTLADLLPDDNKLTSAPLFALKNQISGKYMPLVKGDDIVNNLKNVSAVERMAPGLTTKIKGISPENINYMLRSMYSFKDTMLEAVKNGKVSTGFLSNVPILNTITNVATPLAPRMGTVSMASSKIAGTGFKENLLGALSGLNKGFEKVGTKAVSGILGAAGKVASPVGGSAFLAPQAGRFIIEESK